MSVLALLLLSLAAEPAPADAPAEPPSPPSQELARKARPAPANLLRFLRQKTLGEWCDRERWTTPGTLEVSATHELKDGGLLLFVQVPNYLCSSSNSAVPVMVSKKGKWTWGAPVNGHVRVVATSPDGTLWATSEWQIEGTYPMVLRSRDGLSWRELDLPTDRATTAPEEKIHRVCFAADVPEIVLEKEDPPTIEAWRLAPADAGLWAKISGPEKVCSTVPQGARAWRPDETEDRFLFSREGLIISLPKQLRPR